MTKTPKSRPQLKRPPKTPIKTGGSRSAKGSVPGPDEGHKKSKRAPIGDDGLSDMPVPTGGGTAGPMIPKFRHG